MRVFCYFNLHKHCFSLRALDGPEKGRVIAHSRQVLLRGVTFRVSQAGRARVLRERSKNVHAGVVGTLVAQQPVHMADADEQWIEVEQQHAGQGAREVSYNPYLGDSFYYRDSNQALHSAREVHGKDKRLSVLAA